MAYQLIEHPDPRRFHGAVIDHLLQREAENCAVIGLAQRMQRDGYSPISSQERDQPILWTVQCGASIETVAVQTLKTGMLATRGSPEAMHCLAETLVAGQWGGDTLIGPAPAVAILAERYASLSNRPASLAKQLRVFQLDQVSWPASPGGSMRICRPEDREILAKYLTAFANSIGEPTFEDPLIWADRAIAAKRLFFWTDPDPVAIAGWAGPTPNGIRINSVYTPPEFRGRGYASNLVAHLSQHLLDQGRRFCFLFTDLANPISNSIYQKIGYRPVSDSDRWKFGPFLKALS